jgi:hypothetical protein
MELKILTLAERNTYSGANGLAFMVTIMAVLTVAATGDNLGLVLLVAALSGLWLAAWSRLTYSLIEAADRWIAPLISLAVLCCLLAALAESWLTLLGAATLLFVCWLPYMLAEWAGQRLRVWAYFSESPHARRVSQVAHSVVDIAAIGGTAVLMAATVDGRVAVRIAAALVMTAPLLVSRTMGRVQPSVAADQLAGDGERD